MSTGLIKKIGILVACLLAGTSLSAQNGTYSGFTPYSVYGIGDLHPSGTAFSRSMGGVGVAMRNRRYINTLNPASVTARDSLSFMADFGLSGKNVIFRQNDYKSANNTFNINDFVISFPIKYRKCAVMVGVTPFSNVGYKFTYTETDPSLIGVAGNMGYTASGSGSIYQFFTAVSYTLWDRLSVGAQYNYYFGNLQKDVNFLFSNSSYRSIYGGFDLQLKGSTGKFGIQYEQPFDSGLVLAVGATYRMKTRLRGYAKEYTLANLSTQTDTLKNHIDTLAISNHVSFADEWAVGFSIRRWERWSFEVDYIRSGWGNSGFDAARGFTNVGSGTFSASTAQSIRAGFEFTPNRNDIRYRYRRWTYRAGAYYDEAYYKLNGNTVTGFGVTLGMTFPVYAGYNGITVGLDLGQRGRLDNNMIRERYIGINVGVNIFDLWFHKMQFE